MAIGGSMTATAQVRVWDGPKELTLTPAKTEVTKGSGTQISVTDEQGNDVDAESVTWASSDETVAQVSGGWVDVTGTGAVTITATTEYGISASVELTGAAPAARPATSAGAASGAAAGSAGSSNTGASTSSAPAAGEGHGYWTVYGDGGALDLINGIRASAGLGALSWDDSLGDIAAARCRQLMDDFSHNGMTAPEICAMGAPDASSVVSSWQASSAHYAQMVNAGYTRCAVAHCYDGDGCHYWCATFG